MNLYIINYISMTNLTKTIDFSIMIWPSLIVLVIVLRKRTDKNLRSY